MVLLIDKAVNKASGTLPFISQEIDYGCWDVMLHLFNTLVRSHLKIVFSFSYPTIGMIPLGLIKCRKHL